MKRVIETEGLERRFWEPGGRRGAFVAAHAQEEKDDEIGTPQNAYCRTGVKQEKRCRPLLPHKVSELDLALPRMPVAALLPLQPRRELDDTRIVRLLAQIDQPSRSVRIQAVRVIERVKEVGGEPNFYPLRNIEILKQREVFIP